MSRLKSLTAVTPPSNLLYTFFNFTLAIFYLPYTNTVFILYLIIYHVAFFSTSIQLNKIENRYLVTLHNGSIINS